MSNLKRWTAMLLAMILLLSAGAAGTAYARADGIMTGADLASADSDYDGIPDEFDAAPDSNVFTGRLKSGHDGTTSVSYTVDYRVFFGDNTAYDPDLASVSVMGAALAYYEEDYSDAYFVFDTPQTWAGGTASKVEGRQLMQVLGFEDVTDYSLDTYGDDDICEMLLGHRTVTFNGETAVIVAIWVRGTDSSSMEEWSANFHMGDLVRFFDAYDSAAGKSPRQSNDDWTRKTNHRGFDVCATRLLRYLNDYYLEPYVQPALDAAPGASTVYWLTGHSRGAAVANLMSSYLIDRGERVYAYTFAAPYDTANTEASAERYDCIFNLVNANDFIPMLPMPEWGFTRYGRTATVDASAYAARIKAATGTDYSGSYLSAGDISTLLGKFICITGENADRSNPGKILGWREVYVYHCGHDHEDETVGNYQSTTFVNKQSLTNWGGPTESGYNGYAVRLRKYSYWHDGICETPAYDLQVLVELLVKVAQGETIGGASTYITSNKLAAKFDFDKWSLISYATKLTEPHLMDTYSVIQAEINAAGDPGAIFRTLSYYTDSGEDGGRPAHTHTYVCVPYEGREPTCTEDGLGYRFCLCSQSDPDYYDDYQKNVTIPAVGHEWGEPVWSWAENYSAAGVSLTCARCGETVSAAAEITVAETAPTSTEAGSRTYTATAELAGQTLQDERTEILPLLGHALRIVSQPEDASAEVGAYVRTSVAAEGDGLTYQWYVKNAGASRFYKSSIKQATYVVKMSAAADGRQVYCVVTDESGSSVTSETATLRMIHPLAITAQPEDASAEAGAYVRTRVAAEGDGLTYQWYVKNAGTSRFYKSSIKQATYVVKMSAAADGRQVYCVVTDAYGSSVTSETATLRMGRPLAITAQPEDVSAAAGVYARTRVAAEGEGLTYQWYLKNAGASRFTRSSITQATYVVKMSAAADGRQVYCVVTDESGNSVTSEIATLTMLR